MLGAAAFTPSCPVGSFARGRALCSASRPNYHAKPLVNASPAALREIADSIERQLSEAYATADQERELRLAAEAEVARLRHALAQSEGMRSEMEKGRFGDWDKAFGELRKAGDRAAVKAAKAEKEVQRLGPLVKEREKEARAVGADRLQLAALFLLIILISVDGLAHTKVGADLVEAIQRILAVPVQATLLM